MDSSKEKADVTGKALSPSETHRESVHIGNITESDDQLKRHLGNRQIQLIAIGGSIGTATFVSISNGLVAGGPGSLFLAYTIYSCMMGLVNNCVSMQIDNIVYPPPCS